MRRSSRAETAVNCAGLRTLYPMGLCVRSVRSPYATDDVIQPTKPYTSTEDTPGLGGLLPPAAPPREAVACMDRIAIAVLHADRSAPQAIACVLNIQAQHVLRSFGSLVVPSLPTYFLASTIGHFCI